MDLGWFSKSLMATVLLVPIFLLSAAFAKSHGARPDAITIWWYLGIIVGTCTYYITIVGKPSALAFGTPALWMLVAGTLCGAAANVLLFQAVVAAPNPGLPASMVNVSALLVVLLSVVLARWLPEHFPAVRLSWPDLGGVMLIIAGLAVIALNRNGS